MASTVESDSAGEQALINVILITMLVILSNFITSTCGNRSDRPNVQDVTRNVCAVGLGSSFFSGNSGAPL